VLFLLCAPAPRAAEITWNPPQQIGPDTPPCIVNTEGTLVEAFAADRDPANPPSRTPGTAVANGVPFTYTNDMLSSGNLPGALYTFTHPDPGMQDLLYRLDFGSTLVNPDSITVGNGLAGAGQPGILQDGEDYLIQVFNTDLRPCCDDRDVRFGDGLGNTVDLNTAGSGAAGSAEGWGETAIGRFIADATTTQILTVEGLTGLTPQINAYQVRVANDFDEDLVWDSEDNCSERINPGQDDTDCDTYGNLCDTDYDNNGITGFPDFGQFVAAYGTNDEEKCHVEPIPGCSVGFPDFGFYVGNYSSVPGPSGTCRPSPPCQ
jgi:hypothetical protein